MLKKASSLSFILSIFCVCQLMIAFGVNARDIKTSIEVNLDVLGELYGTEDYSPELAASEAKPDASEAIVIEEEQIIEEKAQETEKSGEEKITPAYDGALLEDDVIIVEDGQVDEDELENLPFSIDIPDEEDLSNIEPVEDKEETIGHSREEVLVENRELNQDSTSHADTEEIVIIADDSVTEQEEQTLVIEPLDQAEKQNTLTKDAKIDPESLQVVKKENVIDVASSEDVERKGLFTIIGDFFSNIKIPGLSKSPLEKKEEGQQKVIIEAKDSESKLDKAKVEDKIEISDLDETKEENITEEIDSSIPEEEVILDYSEVGDNEEEIVISAREKDIPDSIDFIEPEPVEFVEEEEQESSFWKIFNDSQPNKKAKAEAEVDETVDKVKEIKKEEVEEVETVLPAILPRKDSKQADVKTKIEEEKSSQDNQNNNTNIVILPNEVNPLEPPVPTPLPRTKPHELASKYIKTAPKNREENVTSKELVEDKIEISIAPKSNENKNVNQTSLNLAVSAKPEQPVEQVEQKEITIVKAKPELETIDKVKEPVMVTTLDFNEEDNASLIEDEQTEQVIDMAAEIAPKEDDEYAPLIPNVANIKKDVVASAVEEEEKNIIADEIVIGRVDYDKKNSFLSNITNWFSSDSEEIDVASEDSARTTQNNSNALTPEEIDAKIKEQIALSELPNIIPAEEPDIPSLVEDKNNEVIVSDNLAANEASQNNNAVAKTTEEKKLSLIERIMQDYKKVVDKKESEPQDNAKEEIVDQVQIHINEQADNANNNEQKPIKTTDNTSYKNGEALMEKMAVAIDENSSVSAANQADSITENVESVKIIEEPEINIAAINTSVSNMPTVEMESDFQIDENGKILTVSFEPRQTSISAREHARLLKLVNQIKNNPDKRVKIVSYASELDNKASSARRISLQRAIFIRTEMIKEGLDSIRINVQAMGNEDEKEGSTNIAENKIDTDSIDRADIYILGHGS